MAGLQNLMNTDSNTMPIAINSGLAARTMVKASQAGLSEADLAASHVQSWGDVFSKDGMQMIKQRTATYAPVADALQQQSFFVRMLRKVPFVGDRLTSFMGADNSALNDTINGLSKDALGGATKAQVTEIVLNGGDVAGNLTKAGLDSSAAKDLAAKAAALNLGGAAQQVATSATKTAATQAANGLTKESIQQLLKDAPNGGVLAGKKVTAAAIRKVLASNPEDSVSALRQIGMRADTAKTIAAQAANASSSVDQTVAKAATKSASKVVAKDATDSVAQKASGGIKGLFGKLLSGAKGNFIVAGIFSIGSNAIQLATGKMNLKQFIALSALDTGAYGAIGMGSAAAGAAIGSIVPGAGTIVGFLAGLGIGVLGGMVYEKLIRNPIKKMLGGGASQAQATPQGASAGPMQDPYAAQSTAPAANGAQPAAQQAAPVSDPTEAGGLSYSQAMAMLGG